MAGLAGGGAGVAVARQAARSSMNCLGRNVLTGAAAGPADGGTSGALSYATSGQPLSVSGFVQATGTVMAYGGAGGAAAGGTLTRVSGSTCFVTGTQVLLTDGTAKAIEDIAVGDEVLAADPETDETVARRVLDTYVTPEVDRYEVETADGIVTSTAEHPFWVEGRGWTPVRELAPGDKLIDADGVRVELVGVRATGETATVYNVNVDELHNYHVRIGESWIRVHNTCGDDFVDLASAERRAHILDGEARPNGTFGGGHRPGTGYPNKSEFPAGWSDDRIMHEISDVATDPASTRTPGGGSDVFATGTRDGIDIEVLTRHDQIWTGYPTNVPRNP